jgi:hypothetical protein
MDLEEVGKCEAADRNAVDTHAREFDPEARIPVPKEISRYCSGLVVVVEKAGNSMMEETVIESAACWPKS